MRSNKRSSRRPSRRERNVAVMEALESRVLLSYTWITQLADTGNIATNGTNLNNILNGTTKHDGTVPLAQGDTLVLQAGAGYLAPGSNGFTLHYLAGAGTITIESSDVYYAQGGLPSGQRVSGAKSQYMPKLLTRGSNAPVFQTELVGGANPTHDYALIGLEVAPLDAIDDINTLVQLGDVGSTQQKASQVPYDFLIDRCYIHGLDPVSNTEYANYQHGVTLNSSYTTISNCEISNIHTQIPDGQAIQGNNGLGHFTITNNYLEGSSECFFYGGGDCQLYADGHWRDANYAIMPTDMLFQDNYVTKRLDWNPYDPRFYDVNNPNHQVKWNIKNLFEFKFFDHATIDRNVFDNCWVNGDQTAEAICLDPKNQGSGYNTWVTISNLTFSNNVVRSAGEGMQLAGNIIASTGLIASPTHDFLIQNNVFEHLAGGDGVGTGYGLKILAGQDYSWNYTIDHNVFVNSQCFMMLDSGTTRQGVYSSGFVVTNNILGYGTAGIQGSAGNETKALNVYANGIRIINQGAGYTAAPTVTFSSGNAHATATITGGKITQIWLDNRGSGYTSVPAITLSASGCTTPAIIELAAPIVGGQLREYAISFKDVNGVNQYGSGYDYSTTTVTFNNGGYTTRATGTPIITNGQLIGINITNAGAGYTAIPTIAITGGGSGASPHFDVGALTTDANGTGQLGPWSLTNNLIFGDGTSDSGLPGNNFYPPTQNGTEDAAFIQDPAGELWGLVSNAAYQSYAIGRAKAGSYYANIGPNPATLLGALNNFVPLDSTLTNYWKFDEGTGTTAYDSLGTTKNLTMSASNLWTTTSQSYDGMALTGGTSGRASVASFTTTANFSFAAWVNPATVNIVIERNVDSIRKTGSSVRVLSGRRRDFDLTRSTRLTLRLRRIIERTMLGEVLFIPVFLCLTPVLLLVDWARGRR